MFSLFFPTAFAQPKVVSETAGGIGGFFSSIAGNIHLWIAAIVVFALSMVCASVLKSIIKNRIISAYKYEVHKEAVILAGRFVYVGVILVGSVIALEILNINLWALVGAMGLGLGFAFKDLLSNFIAGMVILTQKRFIIGDIVKVKDYFGVVSDIDTRVCIVRSYDGTDLIIPNSTMLGSVVQNFTAGEARRRIFTVPVHFKTPLDKAIPYILDSVNKHQAVLKDPKTQVLAREFGESSINLEVRYWIEPRDSWPQIESEIIQQVKADLQQAGVVIPFPIRTLSLDPFDENMAKMVKKGA